MGILEKLQLVNNIIEKAIITNFLRSLFIRFTKFTHWTMLEKNRKKGQKRAKNLTKEKTLDLFDEFRKIHTLPQKKFKKFK
jgi:hypothetical protein